MGFLEKGSALLEGAGLLELGALADNARRSLHPDSVVTFINDRNINYTNICIGRCRFCAFYRDLKNPESFVLSYEEIGAKIDEAKAEGAIQILMQGGLHPTLELEWYTDLLRYIKKNHSIHVHAFSAPEIDHLCNKTGLSAEKVIGRLVDAGLDSIPGAGAEMLCAEIRRKVAPRKIGIRRWLEIHEAAHRLGLRTTATMVYGMGETDRQIIGHLRYLYLLQEKTGGFTAFIPWSFQPENTELPDIQKTGPARYLRILAVSRIILDNIANVQASWVTQGPDVASVSLHFGANDFGSTMLEENVVRAAGCSFAAMDEERIAGLIRKAGFKPALRRQDYSIIKHF